MDNKGQISLEFILVIAVIILIIVCIASFFGGENEITQAMAAARSGAIEGANLNSFAVYPKETFDDYTSKHPRLLSQSNVKIININYVNYGSNNTYNKTKIQLQITASAPSVNTKSDKNALGDRVNFYVRKSICESFGTSNLTNKVFNPAFSNRYVFTTADVKWT
ncbi:MAG: class III signal peptide-containing protein [Methanobacterium sp.]|uniref:class III signal peptide-containing protein n=1 Tax=Methanobacterium sp. TaxID=2164 RepID=UPI003D649C17|nr:class III signal peptide-containing protein [Methanobacterium sp.]